MTVASKPLGPVGTEEKPSFEHLHGNYSEDKLEEEIDNQNVEHIL